MAAIEGVTHAREVLPDGSITRIDLASVEAPCPGWRLIALGGDSLQGRSWLMHQSGLSQNAVRALLEEDTRPRCVELEDGTLLILRGVDTGPKGGLKGMISLRLLAADGRLLVVQRRRLDAFEARVDALDRGEGRASIGAFIGGLVAALRHDAEPVLDRLETAIDSFELGSLEHERPPNQKERHALNEARRATLLLRRYMAPQAEAVRQLAALREPWLDDAVLREALTEEADHFRRAAEDLDSLRARAVIVSDEAALRVAEQTNQRLLTLSIVSLLFLPLTFFTGLMGVNLAGIPFAEEPWSFAAFALTTLAAGVTGAHLLHRRGFL